MHRYVIPLSPPQKKRAARAPFLWRRECIIRIDFSRPAQTLAFVRLIRFASQTCAPCAFKNAQVCDPTLSATKKEPLGLLFCGGESGIRTHEALYGGLHDFESCAFNRAPPSLQLRLPFNNTLFYPDCKAFILTFQPLCLICHLPLYRRRYLPLVFLIYFSSLYSLYSLLFFFISFYFLYAHYIF